MNPPYRIFVVDDNEDIRRLNAEVLLDYGYHVDTAEDGALAWDALQLNHYDLLITDNEMPNLSGIQLLNKLHAAGMALPVIIVSGSLPTEALSLHPWLHIEAMLLKPYTIAELLGTVEAVLTAALGRALKSRSMASQP